MESQMKNDKHTPLYVHCCNLTAGLFSAQSASEQLVLVLRPVLVLVLEPDMPAMFSRWFMYRYIDPRSLPLRVIRGTTACFRTKIQIALTTNS